MRDKANCITLSSGGHMPVVGLGTYLSKNENIITDLLRAAIKVGYRHIDTAYYYDNHKMIG